MKIAFLIQDITTAGGTERTTCNLASEFAKHGHQVAIISCFMQEKEPHFPVDPRVSVTFLSHSQYSANMAAARRIAKVLSQTRSVRRCRQLVEADFIISQKIIASALCLLSRHNRKTIACEHFKYEMYTPVVRSIRNRIYRTMRQLVVLTDADKAKYIPQVAHTRTIENMAPPASRLQTGHRAKRIIAIGRLSHEKGFDLLLQAAAMIHDQLKGWRIDIYGDGAERAALEELRTSLDLCDIVSLHGHSDDIFANMATSEIFVLPSRHEGLAMVILEAAACGLPIIAFDSSEGTKKLLSNDRGLLVKAEDTRLLSEAIKTLVLNDESRKSYASRSQAIAEEYSPGKIYAKWLSLFDDLINPEYNDNH